MDTIELATHDGPMPALAAGPRGAARGAVVVVQEAFGLTDHIGRVTERLAEAGWYALAPAFFHRQGSPVFAYDDYASIMPVMAELTAGGIATDLAAAYAHTEAEGHPLAHTGTVGFCMGGSITLYAATLRPLGAAVTFYGGGVATGRFGLPSLIDLAPTIEAPWLGLYGDLDQSIPVEEVERLREAAGRAKAETEVVRYPDAGHGFNCDERDSYDEASATDAWARTLAWFDRHL